MKKTLIALAVLAASGAAMAQSSVTLYGIADAFVSSKKINTVTVVNGNQLAATSLRQTGVDSSGLSASRWGLRGNEDLGGGMNAIFVLESGFNIDTGATASSTSLFSRQAFVGLNGGFGTVSLGRHQTAYEDARGRFLSAQDKSTSFDATNGAAPLTGANIAALNSYFGTAPAARTNAQALAAATALTAQTARVGAWVGYQSRVDNSIRYETPNISGFKGAVVYGFGENKNTPTPNTDATKNYSGSLTYANGPVAVALVYQKDEPISGFHLKNTAIGGNYDFGVAKAFLSYNQAKYDGLAKQNEWAIGARMPLGATTLVAQYAQSKGDDLGKNKSFGLEAQYSLSKRTTAYAAFNQTKVETLDSKNSIFGLGVRHTF